MACTHSLISPRGAPQYTMPLYVWAAVGQTFNGSYAWKTIHFVHIGIDQSTGNPWCDIVLPVACCGVYQTFEKPVLCRKHSSSYSKLVQKSKRDILAILFLCQNSTARRNIICFQTFWRCTPNGQRIRKVSLIWVIFAIEPRRIMITSWRKLNLCEH